MIDETTTQETHHFASAAEPSARQGNRCVSQTLASWPTTSLMALATAEMDEQPASASRNLDLCRHSAPLTRAASAPWALSSSPASHLRTFTAPRASTWRTAALLRPVWKSKFYGAFAASTSTPSTGSQLDGVAL